MLSLLNAWHQFHTIRAMNSDHNRKLPSLDELLAYRHHDVLLRYANDFSCNKLSAEQAFHELMKFLWIAQKLQLERDSNQSSVLDFSAAVFYSMREIDDMWHTFILFTHDYTAFSQQFFGDYLHHQPSTDAEKAAIRSDLAQFLKRTEKWIAYIYDHFGEETVRLWFSDYLAPLSGE